MKIICLENGPILLSGPVGVIQNGKLVKGGNALCRCGHSNNSPFCDGSHKQAGFKREAIELTVEFSDTEENER